MEIERWRNFTKSQQFLIIGSELMRAKTWQKKDREKFTSALERALDLIDLTLCDNKWQNNLSMILWLREEIAKFYTSKRTDDISSLYNSF